MIQNNKMKNNLKYQTDYGIDWMQQLLPQLGNLTLRNLCIPGSHDAGMSQSINGTAGAFNCNTITQTTSIYNQLVFGTRYFDIRPIIGSGLYWTGHYSYINSILNWQGARGVSINQIIEDINQFTQTNKELIILSLSHAYNTDTNYSDFTQQEWYNLFDQLLSLNYLNVKDTTDLTLLKLNDFIENNEAAVIVIVNNNVTLNDYAKKGFYTQSQLNIYDSYANSNDVQTMENDQFGKMKTQRTSKDSECFLLSWTLTQTATEAAGCLLPFTDSILDLAAKANSNISNIYNNCTNNCYPNIIHVDNVSNRDILDLVIQINQNLAL